MHSSRWDRYISIVWESSMLWTGHELESTLGAPAAWNRLITNPFPQFTVLLISNYVSNLMQNRMRNMLSPYRSVRVKPWSFFSLVTDCCSKACSTPHSRVELRCLEVPRGVFPERPNDMQTYSRSVPIEFQTFARRFHRRFPDIRAGCIIPLKKIKRASTLIMKYDPYT